LFYIKYGLSSNRSLWFNLQKSSIQLTPRTDLLYCRVIIILGALNFVKFTGHVKEDISNIHV